MKWLNILYVKYNIVIGCAFHKATFDGMSNAAKPSSINETPLKWINAECNRSLVHWKSGTDLGSCSYSLKYLYFYKNRHTHFLNCNTFVIKCHQYIYDLLAQY